MGHFVGRRVPLSTAQRTLQLAPLADARADAEPRPG